MRVLKIPRCYVEVKLFEVICDRPIMEEAHRHLKQRHDLQREP